MIVSLNVDFKISLESNPTTGYVWEALFDGAFLDLKKKDFKASDAKSVGAGGKEIFTFIPIRTGKTEITMVHKRPWESASLEERKFPIEIVE